MTYYMKTDKDINIIFFLKEEIGKHCYLVISKGVEYSHKSLLNRRYNGCIQLEFNDKSSYRIKNDSERKLSNFLVTKCFNNN